VARGDVIGPLREPIGVVLVVVAAALAVVGGVTLYVREEIVDSHAFGERAAEALDRDALRQVVAREVVVQLVERGSTDLVSARPVIESVVEFVVRTPPFRHVIRLAARHANRLLFVREGGNAAFDVADAGTLVASALRGVAPDVARRIPRHAPAQLLELRKRSFATESLRFAEHVRTLGIVLPLLAVLLLALAVAAARDRRRAVTRAGLAIGAAAGALVIALVLARAYVVRHVYGSDELTNADVRGAVGALWDAYLADLTAWALGVGAIAFVMAAASASLLRPFAAGEGLARLRARLGPPQARAGRIAHGAVAIALGVFVVLQPALALRVGAVIAGGLVLYYGVGEVLSVVYSPRQRRDTATKRPAGRRIWAVAGGVGAVAIAVGVALAAVLGGGTGRAHGSARVRTCNGYAALCSRRLDQVVFAGTHNSMSSADTRGWLLVNQRRTIRRQLDDGIRLFLIDPHYGVRQPNGVVRTDFHAERRGLNRVSKSLSPAALGALERLGARVGGGDLGGGRRDVWLCHSVCELGATRMRDALATIRGFLERNRGSVVVLFDEDYVSERDLARVYRESGLMPYLVTLDRLRPLPTLGELVRADKRVLVFTERRPSGRYAWDMDGFAWVQDTPLGATKAGELRCARNRGEADSPLLMLNNWIDRFPPPAGANRAVLRERFILARGRRCHRARGMLPNLIASDFYDQGHLIDAVRRLNGLGNQRPARVR
jgi:hypothetical protein